MKKMWGTRVLAMLLVLALTAGLVPAALAANSEAAVAFKQVPNDTLDTLIRPDVAVGEIEDAEMGEDTAAYQAHDLVRVSIILEDTSTLEAYSDAAAEGTLAEDAAAVSYRAALQRKQDSVVRKISSTILGRQCHQLKTIDGLFYAKTVEMQPQLVGAGLCSAPTNCICFAVFSHKTNAPVLS